MLWTAIVGWWEGARRLLFSQEAALLGAILSISYRGQKLVADNLNHYDFNVSLQSVDMLRKTGSELRFRFALLSGDECVGVSGEFGHTHRTSDGASLRTPVLFT